MPFQAAEALIQDRMIAIVGSQTGMEACKLVFLTPWSVKM